MLITEKFPFVNRVVDLSHYDVTDKKRDGIDFADESDYIRLKKRLTIARDSGLIGVIWKGTEGTVTFDTTYKRAHEITASLGLRWGAYHFGAPGDGAIQADGLLQFAELDAGDVVALDFERNRNHERISIADAEKFVTRIHALRGVYPLFYSGHDIKEALGTSKNATLGKCPLWLAQYGAVPVVQASWSNWSLWQYAADGNGLAPHNFPGIGQCDRNLFHVTSEDDLRTWWDNGGGWTAESFVAEEAVAVFEPAEDLADA